MRGTAVEYESSELRGQCYKANAIRKILGNRCGVASVEQVSNVEDGLKMLKDAENAGEPFNLIITDMHFPMRSGAISDTEAREKLVQILQAARKSNQHYRMFLKEYETSRCVWMYLVFGNQ